MVLLIIFGFVLIIFPSIVNPGTGQPIPRRQKQRKEDLMNGNIGSFRIKLNGVKPHRRLTLNGRKGGKKGCNAIMISGVRRGQAAMPVCLSD